MKRHSQYPAFAAVFIAAALSLTPAVVGQSSHSGGVSSLPTPRMPDGKPDLNGFWKNTYAHDIVKDANGDLILRHDSRRCDPTQKGPDGKGCFEETNQTTDGEFTSQFNPNRPLYRPEYWDKVQDLDYNTNTKDPIFTCLPLGLPRIGPPEQILQTAKYVVFLYSGAGETTTTTNVFRIIPVDGRRLGPQQAQDIKYYGNAVGRWEGDTLIVESVGFNNDTWLAGGGFFHSYDMKVTERLRREGNTLHYQATVEDPKVLLQPWVMNPRVLRLNPDPNAYIEEGYPCSQPDPEIQVTKIRH